MGGNLDKSVAEISSIYGLKLLYVTLPDLASDNLPDLASDLPTNLPTNLASDHPRQSPRQSDPSIPPQIDPESIFPIRPQIRAEPRF